MVVISKMQQVSTLLSNLVSGHVVEDAIKTQYLDTLVATSTVTLKVRFQRHRVMTYSVCSPYIYFPQSLVLSCVLFIVGFTHVTCPCRLCLTLDL